GAVVVSFLSVGVGFLALRFFGQGTLTMSSRNMVMKWFEKRRGAANAVLGVTVSLGFSAAPRFIEIFVQGYGWREAWRIFALMLMLFAGVVYLFYRDNPQELGMKPDGKGELKQRRRELHREAVAARDFRLSEARRMAAFWFFALSLALSALVVTAFTFHVVSVFGEAGWNRTVAVSVFLPSAVVAVVMQFGGSWVSDYIPLKVLGLIQLLGIIALAMGVLLLSGTAGILLSITGLGLTQGMMGILSNITWPRFFGLAHLGEISGFAMAWTVGGSALGPFLFSLSLDLLGSYSGAAIVCIVIAGVLLAVSAFVRRPE
ncbi:MAG TPA: MFS transporter, partial [Sediminispirochaeta sp.]|nr:MFS transporter [Sediminispirochaeta sp.]